MTPLPLLDDVPSDPELIAAARAGDDEAYTRLYERHLSAARAAARAHGRSRAAGDDLVAEAFTRLLADLRAGGRPEVAFRPFLVAAVRTVVQAPPVGGERSPADAQADAEAEPEAEPDEPGAAGPAPPPLDVPFPPAPDRPAGRQPGRQPTPVSPPAPPAPPTASAPSAPPAPPTASARPTAPAPPIALLDPAVPADHRPPVATAYAGLPERWQLALWHTEVEGDSPAAVAPLLGLAPNAVAALAYRAREGLRTADVQVRLAGDVPEGCRATVERLPVYVRDGLSAADHAAVEEHLAHCPGCTTTAAELRDVRTSLRRGLVPLVLGAVPARYLTAVGAAVTARRGLRSTRAQLGLAAAALAAVVAAGVAVSADDARSDDIAAVATTLPAPTTTAAATTTTRAATTIAPASTSARSTAPVPAATVAAPPTGTTVLVSPAPAAATTTTTVARTTTTVKPTTTTVKATTTTRRTTTTVPPPRLALADPPSMDRDPLRGAAATLSVPVTRSGQGDPAPLRVSLTNAVVAGAPSAEGKALPACDAHDYGWSCPLGSLPSGTSTVSFPLNVAPVAVEDPNPFVTVEVGGVGKPWSGEFKLDPLAVSARLTAARDAVEVKLTNAGDDALTAEAVGTVAVTGGDALSLLVGDLPPKTPRQVIVRLRADADPSALTVSVGGRASMPVGPPDETTTATTTVDDSTTTTTTPGGSAATT